MVAADNFPNIRFYSFSETFLGLCKQESWTRHFDELMSSFFVVDASMAHIGKGGMG